MLYIPVNLWQQECVTITKHAHHVINIANEMPILIDEDGAVSGVLQCSQVSYLCKITSALLVKLQSWKLSFEGVVCCVLFPVCG